MRWTVEGADEKTGRERVISIAALTAVEAEGIARRRGLLVSAVRAPDELPYAQRLAGMIQQATPTDGISLVELERSHAGLQIGSVILLALAVLNYVFAAGAVTAAILSALERPTPLVPLDWKPLALLAIAAAMFGAILHGLSVICGVLHLLLRSRIAKLGSNSPRSD